MRPTSIRVLVLINKIFRYRTLNSTHELHPRPFYAAKVTVWFAVSSDSINYFFENAKVLQERWPNRRFAIYQSFATAFWSLGKYISRLITINSSSFDNILCITLPLLISLLPVRDN
jgi:hypothetical protein